VYWLVDVYAMSGRLGKVGWRGMRKGELPCVGDAKEPLGMVKSGGGALGSCSSALLFRAAATWVCCESLLC
jgi:hypothetical protein